MSGGGVTRTLVVRQLKNTYFFVCRTKSFFIDLATKKGFPNNYFHTRKVLFKTCLTQKSIFGLRLKIIGVKKRNT